MRSVTIKRLKCEKCNMKIPKRHPKLKCSICNQMKHLSCQKLTKADANYINYLKISWTCWDCTHEILPVGGTSAPKRNSNKCNTLVEKFKVKCSACNGYSYSPKNVRSCYFCEKEVHAECWNNELGCVKCCEDIIPGFFSFTYEIIGDPYLKNNKMYNPYTSSHFTQLIGDMIEREENQQNFGEISELLISCKYKKPTIECKPKNNELSILSQNIQTIGNKIENLRVNISYYEQFDALLFNETNCIVESLPHGKNDLLIEGFHDPIVQPPKRRSGKGGGLITYINKRVCEDLADIEEICPYAEQDNTSGEFQFIQIKNCKGNRKTAIIVNVYRSPSSRPEQFNVLYNKVLQKLSNNRFSNKIKYIAGDINQDLINFDNDVDCQNLIDNAHNNGFVQIVSRPTRITENSATLIDHVYVDNIDSVLSCNIITLDTSDHLATHTKLLLGSSSDTACRIVRHRETNKSGIRMFNEANNLKFSQLIEDENWAEITDDMDAQTAYDKFEEIYTGHYNTAYPLKSVRIRRKNERLDPKPWILPWLEEACARRQTVYHEFVKTPTPENKAVYDKMNKFCDKHIDLAKAKYRKAYLEKYKNNSRKQWQMINGLLNRNKNTNNITKIIDDDGKSLGKPSEISETFNKYFSNIAANLKGSITCNNGDLSEYLNNRIEASITLEQVYATEVHGIINKFQNKATRDTKITALKIANKSFSFTNTLSLLINKSFEQGVFPNQLKVAKVIPIYKEGQKTSVGNYRPISLLSTFSKIYEKLMHKRIMGFLDKNNSLYVNQNVFDLAASVSMRRASKCTKYITRQ